METLPYIPHIFQFSLSHFPLSLTFKLQFRQLPQSLPLTPNHPLLLPPHATLSSLYDYGCATIMASAVGSPSSPPLQDNVNIERCLREANDHLLEAIKELQICLIIGFSSQESRPTVSLFWKSWYPLSVFCFGFCLILNLNQ